MTLSPSRSPADTQEIVSQPDETQLPKGQCRFILTTPGLKGYRCACVGFHLNNDLPGASCDCGHMSCFHVSSLDDSYPTQNQVEMEQLKRKVQELEEQIDLAGVHGGLPNIVARVSQLEEALDKTREETQAEIKGSYRNITGAWQLVEQMQGRMAGLEDICRTHSNQLERAGKELQDLRNRNLELIDSDESLEERIEKLESADLLQSPSQGPSRRQSVVDSATSAAIVRATLMQLRQPPTSHPSDASQSVNHKHGESSVSEVQSEHAQPGMLPSPSTAWTVHVSLLPSKHQPRPFEKDSNAYKRCLSRGLHRMVAVEGSDARSFVEAVTRAFDNILQERAWIPLQAKRNETEHAQALPTLRLLGSDIGEADYDETFLRTKCAVCDSRGRIESVYIAARDESLPWTFIRALPVFLEGLERSWKSESDGQSDSSDNSDQSPSGTTARSQFGDLLPSKTPLKRSATELSLATGFDPASLSSDGDSPRSKIPRTCGSMIEVQRGIGTAL